MKKLISILSIILLSGYQAIAGDEPSIGNLNKNLNAARDQFAHHEMISYLFMAVGFIIVLAFAWMSSNSFQRKDEDKTTINPHSKYEHDPYFKKKHEL